MKASSLSAGALALGAVAAEAAPVLAPAVAEAEAPAGQVYANSLNFRTRKNIVPLPKFSAQKVAEGVPDSQLTRETTGWSYRHSRDLTGFIDGTENPSLLTAAEARIAQTRETAKGHVKTAARDAAIAIVERLTGDKVSADDAMAALGN